MISTLVVETLEDLLNHRKARHHLLEIDDRLQVESAPAAKKIDPY